MSCFSSVDEPAPFAKFAETDIGLVHILQRIWEQLHQVQALSGMSAEGMRLAVFYALQGNQQTGRVSLPLPNWCPIYCPDSVMFKLPSLVAPYCCKLLLWSTSRVTAGREHLATVPDAAEPAAGVGAVQPAGRPAGGCSMASQILPLWVTLALGCTCSSARTLLTATQPAGTHQSAMQPAGTHQSAIQPAGHSGMLSSQLGSATEKAAQLLG
jgi:hypothetical protein